MVFPGNIDPRPSTMARFARSMRLLGAAALATAALAAPVLGQGFDIRSLFNAPSATGTVPPAAAPAAPASPAPRNGAASPAPPATP